MYILKTSGWLKVHNELSVVGQDEERTFAQQKNRFEKYKRGCIEALISLRALLNVFRSCYELV